MQIRPIRTKADHRAALKEVERLWSTNPGTPDGDRVEVLVTLIEDFEDKHFPIPAPDPIAAINFMLSKKAYPAATSNPPSAAAAASPKY